MYNFKYWYVFWNYISSNLLYSWPALRIIKYSNDFGDPREKDKKRKEKKRFPYVIPKRSALFITPHIDGYCELLSHENLMPRRHKL